MESFLWIVPSIGDVILPVTPSPPSHHARRARGFGHRRLAEANEREVPERRHRAPLDQADLRRRLRPAQIARPCKLGAPAEPPRRWREPMLKRAAQARLGANAAHQNDLAARLEDASELVERSFRIGN